MSAEPRRRRLRSFLAGSVLGGLVVLAAPRARRRNLVLPPRGLAAFESAPCFDNRTGASEAVGSPRES